MLLHDTISLFSTIHEFQLGSVHVQHLHFNALHTKNHNRPFRQECLKGRACVFVTLSSSSCSVRPPGFPRPPGSCSGTSMLFNISYLDSQTSPSQLTEIVRRSRQWTPSRRGRKRFTAGETRHLARCDSYTGVVPVRQWFNVTFRTYQRCQYWYSYIPFVRVSSQPSRSCDSTGVES